MKNLLSALALASLVLSPVKADWTFGPAMDITSGNKIFHHLEASGRQSLSVSAGHVAIAWEDDRSGTPRCYLAILAPGQTGFTEQPFGGKECFAPGTVSLMDGRFGLIWEDEGGIHAALAQAGWMGTPVTLADAGSQGVMAWHPTLGLVAAWSAPEGRWQRLLLARLGVKGDSLSVLATLPVEGTSLKDDQMYPALVATASGFTLAWEDRRLGHTVIFSSQSKDGVTWSPAIRVSQNQTGKAQGTDLGRGTGAMRPALALLGGDQVATTWLDKRDFLSGYDVYAALPGQSKNTKVQDSFGDAIAQWHPAAAGDGQGRFAVAWDDDRDGTPDIWLSWRTPQGFAENTAPAAGPGAQTDPVIALDEAGRLHLAWVERMPDGQSRLRYSLGLPGNNPAEKKD